MTSAYSDPRIPSRDRVVLRYLLERHADERGDQCFVKFADGSEWSYTDMIGRAKRYAAGLRTLGVDQDDHVLAFLQSSPEALELWYGLNYIGAVYIPANPAYKGNLLAHVINNSGARVVVTHRDLVERFGDVEFAELEEIVHLHGDGPDVEGLRKHSGSIFTNTPVDDAELEVARPIEPWDTQGVWYTSGTTGPSKGALSSYMHSYSMFGEETWPFVTAPGPLHDQPAPLPPGRRRAVQLDASARRLLRVSRALPDGPVLAAGARYRVECRLPARRDGGVPRGAATLA